MKGAGRRQMRLRGAVAEAAFVARTFKSGRDLDRYLNDISGGGEPLPPEALEGALKAASAGLTQITFAQFLAQRGR